MNTEQEKNVLVMKPPAAGGRNTRQIRKLSLHEETAIVLREMIFEGELAAGERIIEPMLCEQLGVSRTPLREALKVLATEDLVELVPRQGAVVTRVTADDVAAMFEVMEGLERLVGELAAQRADEATLAEFRALHQRMILEHREGRRAEYYQLNQAIHFKLAECTGNPHLVADYERYQNKLWRARYQANWSRERWDQSVAEHEGIMAALEAHDPDRLSALLSQHLRRTAENVIEGLRRQHEQTTHDPQKASG